MAHWLGVAAVAAAFHLQAAVAAEREQSALEAEA
jgi:hypothetical protein